MANGIIEAIGLGELAIVTNRHDKTFLAFVVQLTREDARKHFSVGEQVEYHELWDRGWEGQGARVVDRAGRTHTLHQHIYTVAKTAVQMAADLNIDEDAAALALAGVRTTE